MYETSHVFDITEHTTSCIDMKWKFVSDSFYHMLNSQKNIKKFKLSLVFFTYFTA